jgi:hypothetical protein
MRNKYTCLHTPTHTCTSAYTHAHTHAHQHIHAHKHKHMKGMYKNKPLPPHAPCIATRPSTPPPKALRLSTRHTNPNPHRSHQQASLLPRVPSPPNRSTAPLSYLSHSFTNQRFSLAPAQPSSTS